MSDYPLVILPNVERLTFEFLAAQPEVTAFVPAGRIVTDLSGIKDWPAIRVTQFFDNAVTNYPLWAVTAHLQVEAWAARNHEAHTIAETCRAVMAARMIGVHAPGVVTNVNTFGMQNAPDAENPTAVKHRWLFHALITAHPLQGGEQS